MIRTLQRLTVCAALVACFGCGDDDLPPETETAPFEGVQLKIAVPAGYDFGTSWQIELDEWSARTGATFTLVEYDAAESVSPPNDGQTTVDDATVLVFPIVEAATRQFAPISDGMLSRDNLYFVDLFEGLRSGPASVSGKPTLLPISSPVLVYSYRRDIFDKEKLSPPQTWEEHHKLMEVLDAEGLAVVAPWSEEFRATMFLARAVSYAKHPHQYSLFFDVSTGEPLIDGPGFVRALEELRPALKLMRKHNDVTKLTPADCRRMLLGGKAAVAISLVTENEGTETERPESVQIGFSRLPGHPTAYNGSSKEWESLREGPVNFCTLTAFDGLAIGVSADASERQQQAAWQLLAQITVESRKLIQVFPAQARSLCRKSQLVVPGAFVAEDLSSSETDKAAAAIAASLSDTRLVAELPVVGRKRFRDALSQGIGRFLAEEATAEEALKQVADDWREIIKDIGPKIVLNSYRRSIGLQERHNR